MEKICRTCLRTPQHLLPLFDDTGLSQKIQTICSVEVLEIDNLPRKICAECVININLAYNFRRIIINSDLELKRRLLSCAKVIKPDPEPDGIKVEDRREDMVASTDSVGMTNEWESLHIKAYTNVEDDKKVVQELVTANDKSTVKNALEQNYLRKAQRLGLKRKRLYKCKVYALKSNDYLECRNRKPNPNATKTMCNICGKYVRADNLKKHITTHIDSPVKCKECGKTFKNNESMRSHLGIHKGFEITCEFCGQHFKYRGGYKRHVLKQHTAGPQKKVKCTLCEKLFFEKTDLKKHMRSHTGERPYPCEYCKKGFSSSHALKTHVRKHTNERPYACELCPLAFPQKVSLRTHLKSKHSIKVEENS